MDIMLIDPPYTSLKGVPADCGYNIGLTSLAAYVRRAGFEVGVIMGDLLMDFPSIFDTWSADQGENNINLITGYDEGQRNFETIIGDKDHSVWKKLAEFIRKYNPDVVGISYLTPVRYPFETVARLVKKINPEIKVVAGGPHPTFCSEQVMENQNVDYVIKGEGEIPLLQLLRELKKDIPRLDTVSGLSYRDREGNLHSNAPGGMIANLDELPFAARDLVLNSDYDVYPVHCTSTARGCPYTCSFCADKKIWGGRLRRRSIDNVIEELALLKDAYTIKSIDFVDGTFTYDRKYLETFCNKLIDLNLDIKWRCCARYDNLDEEILKVMKQSGCVGVLFGLESGSDRILNAIDKKITVDLILKVSEMVHQSGIPSITSILIGIPGEDKDDMQATIKLMRSIKTDFFEVNSYTPLPGSRLYDISTDEDKYNVDWLRVSYKSCDSCFSRSISHDDLKKFLSEARGVANDVRNRTIQRFQAAMAASQRQDSISI